MAFKQYNEAPVKTILTGAEKIHITDIDGTLKQVPIDSIGPETESIVSDNSNKVPTSAAIKAFVESKMDDVKMPIEVESAIETNGMGWTDEEEVPAINIEWDGNTEGLERAGQFVKISDLDIPNDQIVGLKYDAAYPDTHEFARTYEITQEWFEEFLEFEQINDDYAFVDYWLIVHKDGAVMDDLEVAHKGIYVNDPEGAELYVSHIYKEASTKEVVHKIDQKYIPQSSGGAMIVNLTFVDFDTPIRADKTLLELGEAFSNGIPVIARVYAENQLVISAQCVQCEEPYESCNMSFGGAVYNSTDDQTYYPIMGFRKLDGDEETRIDFWECPMFA